jgi:hypothetical protein
VTFDAARVQAELSTSEASSNVGSQAFDVKVWTPSRSAPSGYLAEFDVDIVATVGGERQLQRVVLDRLGEESARNPDLAVARAPLRAAVADASKNLTETNPVALSDNWTGLALSGLSDPTYDRIVELANTGPGSRRIRPLSSRSLRLFLAFWRKVRHHAREPELVLCPSGHLQAEWHRNWRRHLEIEFCEDGHVFYGLFNGDRVHEGYDQSAAIVDFLQRYPGRPLMWGQ